MLPGLSALAPMSDGRYKDDGDVVGDFGENFNHGRVVEDDQVSNIKIASNAEGEATKALKRMRERRRSATARKPVGSSERRDSQPHVGDLVRGVNGLQV